ncbi:MAG: AAA family ATPase [Candidatus Gracilibacteria bacterium]|nr:AAA family ATPase [Candidatus Gracilibacteria bacterium]
MFHFKSILIQNFRSIGNQNISFGENKTVFVGKNDSGKTNILKAIEKLLNSKNIKEKDFKNIKKPLLIEAIVLHDGKEISISLEANFNGKEVITKRNDTKEIVELTKQINVIYIPSDRQINKENKENGYIKLIDLILKNKESKKEFIKQTKEKIEDLNSKSGRKKTTLLITLLKLYLYSINEKNNKNFTIFIIDQPENFLHPHATKMLDSVLQQIGETENTQIFYSTHSTELVSNFRKGKYEISDIIFVKSIDGDTKTKTIDNSDGRFNKIMINLIFKNASIFFSDYVILVEGETEKISIPNIYENVSWGKYSNIDSKNLDKEERQNYFNLNYKNISVVDVGGKGALYEWYIFACELFGKENVIALIDRDDNFYIDHDMIIKAIRSVYKVGHIYENEFKKYNWIVLDGEFENYYKIDSIKTYITDEVTTRAEKFGDDFDQEKFDLSLAKLDSRLNNLKYAKKISTAYESIFNAYFRKYSKPTIAFNLSTRLTTNNGYDKRLLKIFADMIEKFDNKI